MRGWQAIPVVVFATGKDSRPQVTYPARDPNCVGVGASTDADQLARYSNHGPEVWVVAPSNGGTRDVYSADVAPPSPTGPVAEELCRYDAHMRDARGLAAGTREGHCGRRLEFVFFRPV